MDAAATAAHHVGTDATAADGGERHPRWQQHDGRVAGRRVCPQAVGVSGVGARGRVHPVCASVWPLHPVRDGHAAEGGGGGGEEGGVGGMCKSQGLGGSGA